MTDVGYGIGIFVGPDGSDESLSESVEVVTHPIERSRTAD
jgi:hypothetical protein